MILERNGKAMKRANDLPIMLGLIFVKISGASQGFIEEDLCQAVCLQHYISLLPLRP